MSTIEKIEVQDRSGVGTTASRRLRSEGIVPANLYGHKKGAVAVQLSGETAHDLIHDGAKVFDLELNGETETVLLRDVQWDTFSKHIMHIDFLRVDPNEKVHVEVPVVLKGTAPGVLGGGILDHHLHTLEIECLAVEVPDQIVVRIGALKIGEAIHVSDLSDLPRGVSVISAADSIVVSIEEEKAAKKAASEESEEAEATAEA